MECKRKAVDMMSERPSEIINSELFKLDDENLEKKDLKYVRQSMYRERRNLHPGQLWFNSPLRIILIDSSVNTLAEQDFTVHLHLISPFFLMKAWRNFWSSTTMTGFTPSDSIF
jgi:hypothetical protein